MADPSDPALAHTLEVVGRTLEDVLEKSKRAWSDLAARFPGQVPLTPVQRIDFLASEYHWSLDHIARLTDRQKYAFIEAALQRRQAGGGLAPMRHLQDAAAAQPNLRRALFDCIAHFRTLETIHSALRLLWDYPAPSCLNTEEINRLAVGLGRGPVFYTQDVADGISELRVNHPTADRPVMFSVRNPGAIVVSISETARQGAEANLAAWLDLAGDKTTASPEQANSHKPKLIGKRSGPRSKNEELLDFDEKERKKKPQLTDKEVLEKFKKKRPKHPIFEADNPSGALRAARAHRKRKLRQT